MIIGHRLETVYYRYAFLAIKQMRSHHMNTQKLLQFSSIDIISHPTSIIQFAWALLL